MKSKLNIENYKTRHDNMLWQCKYGHEWKASFNNIKEGSWHPHCRSHISKSQKDIFDYIVKEFPEIKLILNY